MAWNELQVMVVEDHGFQRRIALRLLAELGVQNVLEGSDGLHALEVLRLQPNPPDVVLVDLDMPGMDGPTWVRAALRHRPGTKVIFVSGYSEVTLSDASAPIPGALFLPKPFSLSELTATVENHLAGRPGPAVSAEATLIH